MNKNYCLIALLATTILGCATTPPPPPAPPYALPENTPFALIRSDIVGAFGKDEEIAISILDGECGALKNRSLFLIKKGKSDFTGYVKLPAKQPVRIAYNETTSDGKYCHVSFSATLEEGKTYSLVGGFAYKAGPIPILTGKQMCQFGILDDETKLGVPVDQRFCSKK